MLWLSEVLLQNPEIESFEGLKKVVANRVTDGELFFQMDIKPPYADTPENWEHKLEAVFTSVR